MRGHYYALFFKDVFLAWTIGSTQRIAKAGANLDNPKAWASARKNGYRLGKIAIAEVVPEPIGTKRKKVKA